MSITTFTFVVLFGYLAILKVVSVLAYQQKGASKEDYFLASRNTGLLVLVLTCMASTFSTATVVAGPSNFYAKGYAYSWVFFFTLIAITMLPLALKIWRLGTAKKFITPGDLLGDFYQSKKVRTACGIVGLLSMLPYAAAQLVAIGKTFEALTGGTIPYAAGLSIACAAIGLYLFFGGSRAVIWTDAVQAVIFSTLLIATAFLTVSWAGGWSNVMETLASSPKHHDFKVSYTGYFENLLPCLAFLFLPYVWQRMYMAKSAKNVVTTVMILPLLVGGLFAVTWVIGTASIGLLPEGLGDSDNVLGALFNQYSPYFGAFVLVAAFSAGMSTVDSQLLSAGSIFTQDLRNIFGKKLAKSNDFTFARVSTLCVLGVLFAWSLSLQSASVLALVILGISINVVLFPAVIGAFYWKKASTAAALTSIVCGTTVLLLGSFSETLSFLPEVVGTTTYAFLTSTTSFILVGLLSNHSALDIKRQEYTTLLSPQQPNRIIPMDVENSDESSAEKKLANS